MTLDLKRNDEEIESCKSKITGPAIVSLIARTALEQKDSFDDIPEGVLNDLIRRFETEGE